MKLLRTLAFLLGTLSLARGVTAPADWSTQRLDNVSTTSNGYYFWPDSDTGAPNILITGSAGTWRLAQGGPPTWTAGAIHPDLTLQFGEFFPNTDAGSVMVQANGGYLQIVTIVGGVISPSSLLSNVGSVTSAGCITTVASGVVTLHVAAGITDLAKNNYVIYATRTGTGTWSVKTLQLQTYVATGVAVSASTATNGKVYFNASIQAAFDTSAMKIWDGNAAGALTTLGGGSYGAIRNYGGTLYTAAYLDRTTNYTNLNAITPGTNTATAVALIPPVNGAAAVMQNLCVAAGADGKVRIAGYDSRQGAVYYAKTDGTVGKVVDFPTSPLYAQVLGIMFDPSGVPLVLYRKTLSEAYVAYPTELIDADGNGRADLVDIAMGSSTANAAISISDSSQLTVQFPVLTGSNAGTGTDLGTVKNTTKNLYYRVQTSPDMVNWSPAPSTAAAFKMTVATVSGARIATGVFSDQLVGPTAPKRFVRLKISRITDNF